MPKILIVEDDPLISRMYQKMFTFEKFEVLMASNGREGLEKASSAKPDVILLDVMMPELNGLEVLENLKSQPETKNIPVIMLTNMDDQGDAQAFLQKGAVKYIVKSDYTPKQVADMVGEVLKAYPASSADRS
jgi:CheY-like chemotaxis protein